MASASVYVYDSNGTLTETAAVNRLTAVDANRIDFEAEITPAGGGEVSAVIGTFTGLRTTMYTAVGSINADGESRAVMVDYSALNDSADMTAPSVVLTPMDGDDDGVQNRGYIWKALALIIAAIVFILILLCSVGYWPC